MADSKMIAPEGKKVHMVKVRAIRDFSYRTGAKVQQRLPNGNTIEIDEEKFVKSGEVVEMSKTEADSVCQIFPGSYAFGGERIGLEAKQRHATRRGEILSEEAAA